MDIYTLCQSFRYLVYCVTPPIASTLGGRVGEGSSSYLQRGVTKFLLRSTIYGWHRMRGYGGGGMSSTTSRISGTLTDLRSLADMALNLWKLLWIGKEVKLTDGLKDEAVVSLWWFVLFYRYFLITDRVLLDCRIELWLGVPPNWGCRSVGDS